MKFTVFTTKLKPLKVGGWVMKFTISGPLSTVTFLRGRQKLVMCTVHSKVDPAAVFFSFCVVLFFYLEGRGNQFSGPWPRDAPLWLCTKKKFSTNVFISDHCKKTWIVIILWILRNFCILYNHLDIADDTYYAATSQTLIIHRTYNDFWEWKWVNFES